MRKSILAIISLATVCLLAVCSGEVRSNEGYIRISAGNSGVARSIENWPPTDFPGMLDEIELEVTLTGNGETILIPAAKATGSIYATVTPGIWSILVEAFYQGERYAAGETDDIEVIGGQTTQVSIKMEPYNIYEEEEHEEPGSVNIDIKFTFDEDEEKLVCTGGNEVDGIYIITGNEFTVSLPDAFESVEWYIDEEEIDNENGNILTIYIDGYTPGAVYRLYVEAVKDGVPYSAEIKFMAEEE